MKTFGRYLVYRLRNTALRTLIFTLLSVLLVQVVTADGIRGFYPEYHNVSLYMHAIVLGVLCTLIPILETAEFKNRRNLDTLYFFPIKREKMALVHYVSGLIQILFVYSVTFFTAWIYLEMQTNYFALGYMLPYYLLSLLLGLVMYSIFMFLFGQANTVSDGVLFCGLWVFVLYIVIWTVRAEILRDLLIDTEYWVSSSNFAGWGMIYTPINNLTVIFQDLIEINQRQLEYDYTHTTAMRYKRELAMFFVWGAIGIAAAIGYFVTFVKKGAEKAGEISNSWFGYKLLIPLYGYSLLLLYDSLDFMTVAICILMVIGYVVYRRGFKFKLSDIIVSGIGIGMILLGVLF
ncbi:MAG: hypothetical protein IJY39_06820 [Clostridia bacterium]|nr:hypothetical protein [Clostridia bacterium]